MSTSHKNRVLSIDGALNFRDLGGYTTSAGLVVKWGQIYRSAQLDRLSQRGIIELADLRIQTVVDLRFSDETQRYPTIVAAVPDAEILSWHDEQEMGSLEQSDAIKKTWRDSLDSNDPATVREAMRVNYPQKLYSHRAIYRKMVLRLCEGKTPLVLHCAAGKDRTGVAAALILSLLGVGNDQIVEDYMLTQSQLEGRVEGWFAGGACSDDNYQNFQEKLLHQRKEMLQPIFDADPTYIQTLLDYVDQRYGSFERYAREKLLLSDDSLKALRRRMLD